MFKVAGSTNQQHLAGAVAANIRNSQEVVLEAMGPSAVNIAIKALAMARGLLHINKIDIAIIPSFDTIVDSSDNKKKTLMQFKVVTLKH